jgi:transposase-like protein
LDGTKWDKMKREKEKKREEIVREYMAGDVSYREMEARHGISSSTLQRWVRSAGGMQPEMESGKTSVSGQNPEGEDAAGVVEMKRLREELRRVELHNKLLNAMIDIAEEQMGVKIRKKPGAGQ